MLVFLEAYETFLNILIKKCPSYCIHLLGTGLKIVEITVLTFSVVARESDHPG